MDPRVVGYGNVCFQGGYVRLIYEFVVGGTFFPSRLRVISAIRHQNNPQGYEGGARPLFRD